MTKGTDTRERIVQQAASLFNTKGYAGASVSDIMDATGLQKGGIYRHFDTKETLALEAFDYAVERMGQRIRGHLAGETTAVGRLKAIVKVFCDLPEEPPVPGGCPIMNAAIENDDGNAQLRERSQAAMERLLGRVRQTVEDGIAAGEIGSEVDSDAVATVMIATLEGSVMLSRLYGDQKYAAQTAAHLKAYIDRELRPPADVAQP